MADHSAIEWTNATWNPVTGCTKVSPGCDHCYAERLTERFGRGPFSEIRLHPERLEEPSRWNKSRMVFTCSMSDLFHPQVPWTYLIKVFSIMQKCHWHTFQVLTKRPGRMAYFATHILPALDRSWPENVWAGTSVELQKYSPRLSVLGRVPARVRFVSAEPLLGELDLSEWLQAGVLHWVIVGGESGPRARPLKMKWVKALISQCAKSRTSVFVKQLGTDWARSRGSTDAKGGNPEDWPIEFCRREFPDGQPTFPWAKGLDGKRIPLLPAGVE